MIELSFPAVHWCTP